MKVKIAYYKEDREVDIPEKNLIGRAAPEGHSSSRGPNRVHQRKP